MSARLPAFLPPALLLACAACAIACSACSSSDRTSDDRVVPSVLPPVIASNMPAVTGTGMPAAGASVPGMIMGAPMPPALTAPPDAGMSADAHAMHEQDAGAAHMHCMLHGEPDMRDDALPSEPLKQTVGFSTDVLVPQGVLDWMGEHEFEAAHDAWHLIRRWDQGCRKSNASADSCTTAQRLVDQGLERADIQQGAPGDGLAFMVMHRHMIRMLKASFPKHADLFRGFTHVPRTTDDAENPTPWRELSWTADNIKGFDTLENIEQHLDQFPTEDDLGQYIENTYRWTAQMPMSPVDAPGSGLHGALHSQWSVLGSTANLIDQSVDVRNFVFWKLHGWIDDVWERYRKAKGMTEDEPDYQQALLDQCMEMYYLMPSHRGSSPTQPMAGSGAPMPMETGYFATNVRPALEATCSGCHGPVGPMAGLILGGSGVTSHEVITGIVGMKASNGEYDLVAASNPDKSWVYLKASGKSVQATCTRACDHEAMPPGGTGLNSTQLNALHQWIMDGATER